MKTKELRNSEVCSLLGLPAINNNTRLYDIKRLIYGDLTHIAHALLQGKVVTYGKQATTNETGFYFTHKAEYYIIEEPKFIVGGIELDEHPVDMLLKGVGYYSVNMWGKQSNYNSRSNLDSKLLNSYYFKTQQGAQAFTQALNQTIQLPKSCHDEN